MVTGEQKKRTKEGARKSRKANKTRADEEARGTKRHARVDEDATSGSDCSRMDVECVRVIFLDRQRFLSITSRWSGADNDAGSDEADCTLSAVLGKKGSMLVLS